MGSSRQLTGACAALSLAFASTAYSQTGPVLQADIPPQLLSQALADFARQTGLQLIYASDLAGNQRTGGAHAGTPPTEALNKLLAGTGLRFAYINSRTVMLTATTGARPAAPSASAARATARPTAAEADLLEEVIVSAMRREESASKVPISMFVWSAAELEAVGARNLRDISALTPAVEYDYFPDYGPGLHTNIAIRGINARNGTTTGIYVGDTSLPPPGNWDTVFGRAFPLAYDLDRVEVLRGPQGTLLGEDSEGGAVRFIANPPSLTESSGYVRTELAATARGDPSYEAGAAAGGPIESDVLGYRVAGWYRSDGGYVNRVDPFTGATVDPYSNSVVSEGLRGALTYAPQEHLRITPSLTWEQVNSRDTSAFYTYLSNPDAGELNNGKLLRQPLHDGSYLASLNVSTNFAAAELTSTTSYFHRNGTATVDDTNNAGLGHWGNPLGPEYPVSYANAITTQIDLKQLVFAEEARLTSTDSNARLSWLVGFFYSADRDRESGRTTAQQIPPWGPGPVDVSDTTSSDRTQYAGFGELSWRLNAHLSAGAGLRVGHAHYEASTASAPGSEAIGTDSPVMPRFDLSYQLAPRSLLYASAASGYRGGGINVARQPTCPSAPVSYRPDTVWSYELGTKNMLQAGRLQFDASIFHINWYDMQLQLVTDPTGACGYTGNAGNAVSNGFDLALQALLATHFKVNLAVAYTDAHYSETVAVGDKVIVSRGDAIGALPLVTSPWSGTFTAVLDFPLDNGAASTLRVEEVYHSRNPGPFYSWNPQSLYYAPTRSPDPATNILNMRGELKWSQWLLALYVNNVLDTQPTLLRRNYNFQDTLFYATTFRPRTIGLGATWKH